MASPLLAPIVAETVLITYRDIKNGSNVNNPIPHFPLPSQYLSVAVVFGTLSLLPKQYDRLSSIFGWGMVIATALNVFTPGKTAVTTNTGKTPTVVPQSVLSNFPTLNGLTGTL